MEPISASTVGSDAQQAHHVSAWRLPSRRGAHTPWIALVVLVGICTTAAGWVAVRSALAQEPCTPGDSEKTTICHVPLGNPGNVQTLCVANGDVRAHLTHHAGDCVGACPCAPPGPTYSTCAPVTVQVLHGEGFVGNSRMARIENGTVPCLHVETAEPASCAFSTASGAWLEATEGDYAKTGQALSRDGAAGGEWVVAAQVSEDGTVPCVALSGRDTAGTPIGNELIDRCVVEVLLSSSNATGQRLENYATLYVCTSSNPHPDGTTPVPETSFCYTGVGAALNDINGTERDEAGVYFPDEGRCHVLWSSGYEVPGAKRPATTSFPAPGVVRTDTPILWRPVNANLDIANASDS